MLKQIQTNLFNRAVNFRHENTHIANSYKEFKKLINKGGFVYAHWDGTSETEDFIKNDTKATIRCIPITNDDKVGACVYSGEKSNKMVLFAKAY
jgi:prolyl-tRNA synthetase